jgi:hypothetical protein
LCGRLLKEKAWGTRIAGEMKPYRPDVKEQKRLYSLRLMFERKRAGKPVSPIGIKSNSEPWIQNPRTLEDVEYISDSIARTAEQWKAKGT